MVVWEGEGCEAFPYPDFCVYTGLVMEVWSTALLEIGFVAGWRDIVRFVLPLPHDRPHMHRRIKDSALEFPGGNGHRRVGTAHEKHNHSADG